MAEAYKVSAIFSANTKAFQTAVKGMRASLSILGSSVKGGIGFGALASIGSSAMTGIGNSVRGLIGEISETNKAWKSFGSNMELSGMASSEIKSVQSDLQDFAAKTIYSSSDMASTFAQLYAVNNKTTTALVKGFGAVAASAENPTQAMKTLSTQATQMAAKPTVAWEDFKLVLEQTPAGISQIAKAMGKTSKELVADVQAGTVSTEDFFAAIEKCGNNKALMNMATQYKSVGEAAEGLTATVAQGLTPAFDALSQGGISIIVSLMGKLSARFDALNKAFAGVGTEFTKAINAILTELGVLEGDGGLESFTASAESAAKAAKKFAKYLQKNAKKVAGLIKKLPQLASSLAAFAIIFKVSKKLIPLAETLTTVGTRATSTSKKVKASAKQMLSAGASFALVGAGALMISAGFLLIAKAAVKVAKAGPLAVGVLAGMLAAVAGLAILFSKMGSQLNTAAVGMLAFGGAVVLASLGMSTLAGAAATLADGGGVTIAVFAGMVVAIGALAAVFAKLGPQLTVGAVGMLAFGAAVLMAGKGLAWLVDAVANLVTAIGEGISTVIDSVSNGVATIIETISNGVATIIEKVLGGIAKIADSIAGVFEQITNFANTLPSIKEHGPGAAKALIQVAGGLKDVGDTAGSVSSVAGSMMTLSGSIRGVAGSAVSLSSNISGVGSTLTAVTGRVNVFKSTATGAFNSVKNSVKSSMNSVKSEAKNAVNSMIKSFNGAKGKAYTAGAQIGQGLANGINSKIGAVAGAADRLVAEANRAIVATAKIGSPSKVTTGYGEFIGQGLANGIASKVHEVRSAAAELFQPFNRPALAFDAGISGAMTYSEEMNWSANRVYNITVVSELDGREIARTTAPYTEAELNKRQRRDERKKGRR